MTIRVLSELVPATTGGIVVDASHVGNLPMGATGATGPAGATGATGSIALPVDRIDFSTVAEPAYLGGRLYFQDGWLNLMIGRDGMNMKIGGEMQYDAYNGSASTMTNGAPVYLYGSNTQRIDVRLAANDGVAGSVFGLLTEAATSHELGRVTKFGEVHDLNTNAYPEGTVLYTSDTPGAWSSTPVPGDKSGSRLGIVTIQHPNAGAIFVDVIPIPRIAGTTANRPTTPRLGELYFDTTINCEVVWNGTAWQLPIRPGYTDVFCDVEQAAATGALTRENYRDTGVPLYWWHRSQDDTMYVKQQMPHDWDLGAVEPHLHLIPAGGTTGNAVFSGAVAWSRIGALGLPILSGWTPFSVTVALSSVTANGEWLPTAVSLGSFTPPAAAQGPSAFLHVRVTRPGSSNALDTYDGDKPGAGTAAANIALEGLDYHVRLTGLNTAGLYS